MKRNDPKARRALLRGACGCVRSWAEQRCEETVQGTRVRHNPRRTKRWVRRFICPPRPCPLSAQPPKPLRCRRNVPTAPGRDRVGASPRHDFTPELTATRAGSSPTPGYHQVITLAHGTCLARLEHGSPRAPRVSLPANVHLHQAREP